MSKEKRIIDIHQRMYKLIFEIQKVQVEFYFPILIQIEPK